MDVVGAKASRPLRVLFVCLGDFHAPPSARQQFMFAQALGDAGYAAHVLVGGDASTIREISGNNDTRIGVGQYRFRGPYLSRATLAEVATFSPTIVHVYEPRHGPASAALQLSARFSAPIFVRFADDDRHIEQHAGGGSRSAAIGKIALRRASRLYPPAWPFVHDESFARLVTRASGFDAISPALAGEVARRLNRPCRAILPAIPVTEARVDVDRVRRGYGLPLDAKIITFAGSVFRPHYEDFKILLRAFRMLASRREDVHLVQAGRIAPRYADGQLLADMVGAGRDRFHQLGFLPQEADVARLLAASDVLVQPGAPSNFNRFRLPSKLHDYLAAGRPIVTYAAGFTELLRDEVDAVLTYTADAEELAGKIAQVLDDSNFAAQLGQQARQRARELFSPSNAADALVTYYRERLDSTR